MTTSPSVRHALCAPLAAAAVLVTAGSAQAQPPLEIGVQDDATFVAASGQALSPRRVDAAFGVARDLRARVQKINLGWHFVAQRGPDGETYDWSAYDQAVVAARYHGLIPQITLTGPGPSWDMGNGRTGVFRPSAAAFGRFAAAAAEHFRDFVHTWAIWNEPNWPSWLAPTREAARLYRKLYQAGWSAIKRVDPSARVLFGELAPMGRPEAAIPPLRFLRDVTCRTRGLRATRSCSPLLTDGFAEHPYTLRWAPTYPGPGRDDVTTGSLGRLRSLLRGLARVHALETPAGRAPDLFLTEYGFHAQSHRIPEPLRSRFSVRGFEIAASAPRVRQLIWYQLVAGRSRRPFHWDTALLDLKLRPRPTLLALRDWIRDAVRTGRIAPGP